MSAPLEAAMILAAGRGERMRPLSAGRAKPALPVLGSSMLARIARGLAGRGIRELSVNAHHAWESARDELAKVASLFASVELFREDALMGSGGSLAAPAARLGRHERFLLHNGDTLVDAPLDELAAAAEGERRLGALLVRKGRTPGYSAVVLREGRLVGVSIDPDETLEEGEPATFLGVSVLHRALLERVAPDRPSALFGDLVLPMLREGWSVEAVPYEGSWVEFTDPEGYRRTIASLVSGGRPRGCVHLPGGAAPLVRRAQGACFAAQGAWVEVGAHLRGGVALEAGAVIRGGATVASSVIHEGARIEAGAVLDRCVVTAGTRVPGSASLRKVAVTSSREGGLVTYALDEEGAVS